MCLDKLKEVTWHNFISIKKKSKNDYATSSKNTVTSDFGVVGYIQLIGRGVMTSL